MDRSYAAILIDGEYRYIPISALESARLIAGERGFNDIDVQPFPDHVRIVCTGQNNSFTAKGATMAQACEEVVKKLW